jgi:dienelactone hydrolase
MTYDPFDRGPHPVGVRSTSWIDTSRNRQLPIEIWYPAHPRHRGEDLDPETQDFFVGEWSPEPIRQAAIRDADAAGEAPGPLVVFSHGFAGFPSEASFLCTHLASHGYIVVGAAHVGCTFEDLEAYYARVDGDGKPASVAEILPQLAADRRGDVPFLLDQAANELGINVDSAGICGVSFGGWTSLMAPSVDARVKASVPLCPAGGDNPRRGADVDPLAVGLDVAGHAVPTLMLVGDRDSWLPLYGTLQLFRDLGSVARMVVLDRADHNHFVDDVEEGHRWLYEYTVELAQRYPEENWQYVADSMSPIEDLMPGTAANEICRAMTLAHFDAILRELPEAIDFLAGDPEGKLRRRGLKAAVLARPALTPA